MRRVGVIVGITLLALVAFVVGCAEKKGPAAAEAQKVSATRETAEKRANEQSADPALPSANVEAGKKDTQQEQAKDKPPAKPAAQRRGPEPAERWQDGLKKHDENKDGKLSKKEFKGRDRAFEKLDADGDGAVTQRELAGAAEQDGRRTTAGSDVMKTTDKDGDARISQDEWRGLFHEADADGDGFVTGKEVVTGMQHGAPHRGGRRAGSGERPSE